MGSEVLREFLDHEIGHGKNHLQGEEYMTSKLLVPIEKRHYFLHQFTDLGNIKMKLIKLTTLLFVLFIFSCNTTNGQTTLASVNNPVSETSDKEQIK